MATGNTECVPYCMRDVVYYFEHKITYVQMRQRILIKKTNMRQKFQYSLVMPIFKKTDIYEVMET